MNTQHEMEQRMTQRYNEQARLGRVNWCRTHRLYWPSRYGMCHKCAADVLDPVKVLERRSRHMVLFLIGITFAALIAAALWRAYQ